MKPQMYLPVGKGWDVALSVLNVWKRLGYWPSFRRPRTFNEHFLKEKIEFSGDMALAKLLTDKVEIKGWLNAQGLGAYVIPTVWVSDSIDDMRCREVPARCVIKPAHSSGDVILIKECKPRTLTPAELEQIDGWLKEDYYRRGREPNYEGLHPRVIVEELMLDESGQPPKDYKIECAAGVPFMIQVDIDRFSGHVRQLYSPEWKLLPYCTSFPRHPVPQMPPVQLAKALELARKLSEPFRLCRVDLYFLGDTDIRIGEVTFYPANCAETFEPRSGDLDAGLLIDEIFAASLEKSRSGVNA